MKSCKHRLHLQGSKQSIKDIRMFNIIKNIFKCVNKHTYVCNIVW